MWFCSCTERVHGSWNVGITKYVISSEGWICLWTSKKKFELHSPRIEVFINNYPQKVHYSINLSHCLFWMIQISIYNYEMKVSCTIPIYYICFSDKCSFSHHGYIKRYCCRYWNVQIQQLWQNSIHSIQKSWIYSQTFWEIVLFFHFSTRLIDMRILSKFSFLKMTSKSPSWSPVGDFLK